MDRSTTVCVKVTAHIYISKIDIDTYYDRQIYTAIYCGKMSIACGSACILPKNITDPVNLFFCMRDKALE